MVGNFDVDVEQQQRVRAFIESSSAGDAQRYGVHGPAACVRAGVGFPEVDSRCEHLTDHFGLVSDFLSECWSKLRSGNRVSIMQGRVHLGGALSGRDIEAVNKTVSGLMKLVFPNPEMPVSDEDLEWIVRLALRDAPEGEGATEAVLQE